MRDEKKKTLAFSHPSSLIPHPFFRGCYFFSR